MALITSVVCPSGSGTGSPERTIGAPPLNTHARNGRARRERPAEQNPLSGVRCGRYKFIAGNREGAGPHNMDYLPTRWP